MGKSNQKTRSSKEAPRIVRAKEFLLNISLGSRPPLPSTIPPPALLDSGSSAALSGVVVASGAAGVGISDVSLQTGTLIGSADAASSSSPPTALSATAASLLSKQAGAVGASSSSSSSSSLDTLTVRLKGEKFKHITSRGQRSAAAFREALLREAVVDARIMFASNKQYPSLVFSVIRYDVDAENALARTRLAAANRLFGDAVEVGSSGVAVDGAGVTIAGAAGAATWKERSHSRLLFPEFAAPEAYGRRGGGGGGGSDTRAVDDLLQGNSGTNGSGNLTKNDDSSSLNREPGVYTTYHPLKLDDPAIDLESQRKSYERDGYSMSVLAFQTEQAAKQEINAKFAVVNPWLDCQSLTLSKIRSLKKRAVDAWWDRGWEMSTVALAFVYFEALVYRGLVNKGNRKLAMATCLLIAFKSSEAKEGGGQEAGIEAREVVAQLESKFEVTRAAVLKAEFPIFKHLGFSLNVPTHLIAPHLERILQSKGTNPLDYLGQDLHRRYAILTAAGGRKGVLDQYAPDFSNEDRHVLLSLAMNF